MKCVRRFNKPLGRGTFKQTEKAYPVIHRLKRSKSASNSQSLESTKLF